ncbi:MAG: RIO1 family regulatory kinase/ATPase [Thermofilaceae archaeon]
MLALKEALEAFKQLSAEEFRVLSAVERCMAKYMYVPIKEISKLTGYDENYTSILVRKLNLMGLLQRYSGNYVGYILTSRGYDCLALNTLMKRGVLEGIGTSPLGRGKESDVYPGKTMGNKFVAVKFHRIGRTSFRQTRKVRSYIGKRHHISWLYQSRLAAKSEYRALQILHPFGVSVPKPIDWNRHVVIYEYLEGVELFRTPKLIDVELFKDLLLKEILKAYEKGIIHCDLSEYNVMVVGEKPVLFDWPQWVSSSHPMAMHYLKRDIYNILTFFKRKYDLSCDWDEAINKLLSGGRRVA